MSFRCDKNRSLFWLFACCLLFVAVACGKTSPPELHAPLGSSVDSEQALGGVDVVAESAGEAVEVAEPARVAEPVLTTPSLPPLGPRVLPLVPEGWSQAWLGYLETSEWIAEHFAQARQLPNEQRMISRKTFRNTHMPGHGHLKPGEVALTFDDGPHPHFTPQVLNLLDRHGIKATFFIVGVQARRYPELVKEIMERGHTIATHTYKHPYLVDLSIEDAEWQMKNGLKSTQNAAGDESKRVTSFFRYPGGNYNAETDKRLRGLGMINFNWNIAGHDSRARRHAKKRLRKERKRLTKASIDRVSREIIIDSVLEGIASERRGIILLHDTHQRTVDALSVILDELAVPRRLAATAEKVGVEKFVTIQYISPKSHPVDVAEEEDIDAPE